MAESHKLGRLTRALGIGGAVGIGSILYALAAVGSHLGDEELVGAAQACARQLTDDVIMGDDQYDVVAGAAGACLALLALHRRSPSDWIVDCATACADHLLKYRSGASGMWVSSAFDHPLTGVAHGAAGFALAFSRVYAWTGNEVYRQAAQDCIAFENANFDPISQNWFDLRADSASVQPPNQWCYGAVGIGLARLSMVPDGAVPVTVLADDAERAIVGTLGGPRPRIDSLCCGTAGHVEFLAVAGTKLNRPELRLSAKRLADELEASWASTGDLRWNGGAKTFNSGLFQGVAGIGFVALRAQGSLVPSPLIWE
jgi:lantibiotic modifying enzyme